MPVTGRGDDKQDEKLFLTPDADSERLRQEMLSLEDFMENTDQVRITKSPLIEVRHRH